MFLYDKRIYRADIRNKRERRKKGKIKMQKQDYICEFLDEDINMPTKKVIKNVKNKYGVKVSKRHVQRVRKEERNNNKMFGNLFNYQNKVREILSDSNEDDDVFDSYDVNESCVNTIKTQNTNNNDKDFWEVEIKTVSACSQVNKEVNVYVNRNTKYKAFMFMKWAGAREWLAYLIGEFKDGKYFIYDLFLPDQRTSAALVDKVVAENYNQLKIVGVIHSHHEMGAGDEDNPSFSGHDAAFINSNHNLSLLAGRDRTTGGFKIVGIGRVKTPCDSYMKIKANVKLMNEEFSDEEQALKKEFFEKTQSRTNVPSQQLVSFKQNNQNGYHFCGGGYPGNQLK